MTAAMMFFSIGPASRPRFTSKIFAKVLKCSSKKTLGERRDRWKKTSSLPSSGTINPKTAAMMFFSIGPASRPRFTSKIFEVNLGREAGPMEKNIIAAVFGFIVPDDGSDDVFFHRSRLSPKVFFELHFSTFAKIFEVNLGREAGPMEKNIIAAVIGNDKPEAFVFHHFLNCAVHRSDPSLTSPSPRAETNCQTQTVALSGTKASSTCGCPKVRRAHTP